MGLVLLLLICVSMCSEAPDTQTDQLTVTKFVFCTNVLQNGEYTLRANAQFTTEESIHLYFEIQNMKVDETDGKYAVSLKWDSLRIYKAGTLVDEKHNVLNYSQQFDTDVSYVWMSRPLDVTQPGTYEVHVKVIDTYTGNEVTKKGTFTILTATGEVPSDTPSSSSTTPSSSTSVTEQDIDVTYYYFPQIPSATYHLFGNVYQHYVDVELVNNSSQEIRTKIEAQIMNFTDASFQTVDIPANESGVVSLTPPLMPNVLDLLSEQKRTNFHIKVTYVENGVEKLVFEDTVSVTMLAKRDMVLWMENIDFRENIAAWVTPNDSSIDGFFSTAKKYMPGGSFSGYQEDEEGVFNQLEKIYYTLKTEYKISYVSTPNFRTYNNGEDVIQRIRFPSETLQSGIGNCIETTVLFASIFESLELQTAIMFRPGHAYVAVKTHEYWYFIETTMLGQQDVSFYDALRVGLDTYNKDKPHLDNNEEGYLILHISDCRAAGISPIEG